MQLLCKVVCVALAVVALAACKAEPLPQTTFDTGVPADVLVGDIPVGCPAKPALAAPQIDPFPNPTESALQPFRGVAAGASMITASGGAGNAAPTRVGTDGRFCIEVRLIEDADNAVTFVPLDARGCPGASTVRNVRHQTSRRDAGVAPLDNVALHAPVRTSPDDVQDAAKVNDGDDQTAALVEFYDWDIPDSGSCDRFAWISIDLGKLYSVAKVTLRWGAAGDAASEFAECYSILASTKDSPADPDPTRTQDWKVVAEESKGAAGEQQHAMAEPARHVALLLYENGEKGFYENFQVAEIEVLGQDPNALPPPPAERCE